MTLAIILLAIWGCMLAAPEAPLARLLHRALVEAPARQLAKVTRGAAITLLLLALLFGVTACLLEGDAVRFLSLAAPEVTAWAATFEIGTLVDALVTGALAASAVWLRGFARLLPAMVRRRPRARRNRRTPPHIAANDDDGHARRAA